MLEDIFNDETSDDPVQADDLPKALTPAERKKAAALLSTGIKRNNSAMLGKKNRAKSAHERASDLFAQRNFSPLTEMVMMCEIERAKIHLYEEAIRKGEDPSYLPKPNHERFIKLLQDLLKIEIPPVKSVDIQAKIETGLRIQINHFPPQKKAIEIDAGAPEKLRLAAKAQGMPTLPGATVALVDSVIADIVKEAVTDDSDF